MPDTTPERDGHGGKGNRKRYLSLISLDDAVTLVTTSFSRPDNSLLLSLPESVGQVTAGPVYSSYPVPQVPLAAMDGIAVKSSDTKSATNRTPLLLPVTSRVNTGNILPEGCDSVIMIEDVLLEGDTYSIRSPAVPGQHVRKPGEDIWDAELILPSGHRILPHDIGALATYGISEVSVTYCSVGLIPTGNELVPTGSVPGPGQVVESNSLAAAMWLHQCGVATKRYPIVRDDPRDLRQAIEKALDENDLVLVFSGSSVGTKDFTAPVVAELGTVLAHGIGMRPGKPSIIGKVRDKPVIGLPGYPYASQTALREIVGPLLKTWGFPPPREETLPVILAQAVTSDPGSEDFVRLAVAKIGDRYVGVPLNRGAGVQIAGLHANAYLRVPAALEGFESGTEVTVHLTRSKDVIDRTLFIAGCHDEILDLFANLLQKRGITLLPLRTGNFGALNSLRSGSTHIGVLETAASDGTPPTEIFGREFLNEEMTSLCLAEIPVGLLSRNPVDCEKLSSMRFINRERGCAVREILDATLTKSGYSLETIEGYSREVRHPMSVVDAIRRGTADAGPGSQRLAQKFGLQFKHLAYAKYEFLVPSALLADARVKEACDIALSSDFADLLKSFGCYEIRNAGVNRTMSRSDHSHKCTTLPEIAFEH